jgi:subtilase family serine protease
VDYLGDRCLLSGYSPISQTGLTPAQITAAYDLNAIALTSSSGGTVTGDGTGETIALIEAYHDPSIDSDLKTFDEAYNLPTANLTVVDQAGSQTNNSWAGEETLDVEWAHAIAPGANLLVVEAQSQGLQDLLNAVNTARNTAGVDVISMSWGFPEMSNESSYDSYFTTPAGHVGITFIAASGDNGTVEYPSASPNVLSVGGTTLTLTASGAIRSETAWASSGGGYSQFEPEPSYQKSVQTSGYRSTPDVAFDADPNTGVEVYETPLNRSQGSWQVVGGTSLGAPVWAGMVAIADQGRSLEGLGSLDGPSQTLPALYAAPSTDFNTVSAVTTPTYPGGEGGGGFGGVFNPFGGFEANVLSYWSLTGGSSTLAGATANTATGLGTPIGGLLVSDLAASTLTTPLTFITPAGSSGTGTTPTAPTPVSPKKHHKAIKHEVKRTHAATRPKPAAHRAAQKAKTDKKHHAD